MCEKDYSLLRPFDLVAAERGETIYTVNGYTRKYVAGPDQKNRLCMVDDCGVYVFGYPEEYRVAPLTWVEGRPVYKGDVLYREDCGDKRTVTGIHEKYGTANTLELGKHTCQFDELTWNPPKVKREGWVNVYPTGSHADNICAGASNVYKTREIAASKAAHTSVACVRIEWEE